MRWVLVQRLAVLAGAALLAALVGFAIVEARAGDRPAGLSTLPQPAVSDTAAWYRARAGVARVRGRGTSACGVRLTGQTQGVAHPVLPCGAMIFVTFNGRTALTQVIDHGPLGSDREFDITPKLAEALGLSRIEPIRWTFARAPAGG